jgi:hypothetical protein
MRPSVVRLAALSALAAAAALVVVVWPSTARSVPTPPSDPTEVPRSPGRRPRPADPLARTSPPREGFSTREEAVLLASALDKVEMGGEVALAGADVATALGGTEVRRALLALPGVYLRWQSEAVRDAFVTASLAESFPEFEHGLPPDLRVLAGRLYNAVNLAGFQVHVESPVIWIGRAE